MHLHEFLHLTYDSNALIEYLVNKKVIHENVKCPKCDNILNYRSAYEQFIMHCTNKHYKTVRGRKRQRVTCNFKRSLLHNTWFSEARIDIKNICRFIAYVLLIRPPRFDFLRSELQLSDKTIVDWTNFCREVSY